MEKTQHEKVLKYIDEYWAKAAFDNQSRPDGGWRNRLARIGYVPLPNTAIAPNHLYFAGTQFYWDTYFTILGLVVSGQTTLARGMVDNLCFMYDKFKLIPMRNALVTDWVSQPPYLTRMAWEIFEHEGADIEWMKRVMQTAADEYEHVWMSKGRLVSDLGLSRYRPKHLRRLLTVYESGWDWSERFAHRPTGVVPVDLNSLLFQYEDDLYNWTSQYQPEKSQMWKERMDKRRSLITQYFWDEKTGFFYDYNIKKHAKSPLKTLAGYFPMWSGAATQEQAAACVERLADFEHDFGLANTERLTWKKRQQWDYPNGWPPLQYIVVTALRRYGFNDHAARLAGKWLELNEVVLDATGELWEKYDVVNGKPGLPGRYPTQPGFSWTNAVFLRLLRDLEEL